MPSIKLRNINIFMMIAAAIIMWSGFYVNSSFAASGNSSISLDQLFPGQYDNTKYNITLGDPDGLHTIRVTKAGGGHQMSGTPANGNPPCPTSINSGTVTLRPSDFPLRAVIKDCKDPTISYEVLAQFSIRYPVTELGNCTDQQECKAYCGVASNYSKCAAFAQKNNLVVLVPDDKKAVFSAIQKGESPGGCKNEASCRNYCENMDNLEECVKFVEKFNLASSDELKEIRQITAAKKAGVPFPGNCKTKESCLKYCDNSANAVECMEFAQKAGFIPKEDAEAVSKILPYLKSGGKLPGGCTTKESCDAYCGSDAHTNECIDFAQKAGFMTKEDADIVRKTGGKSPGNCKSKEACESYCKSEAHIDECVDFAVKAGFISKEEVEMAKKFKITSGPGGCKNKAECEAFCVLPENQETCFSFAKDHGMISEEDLKNMGQDIRKEIEVCLGKATCSEFNTCMDTLQQGGGEQHGGQQTPDPKVDAKMKACKAEIQKEKMSACLAKSCDEFAACLKSLEQRGNQGGQQQGEGTPDPAVSAKFQACQQEKINACLAKSCDEFQACLNSLGGGGGGGAPNPAVQAKFVSCFPPPPSGEGQ